MVYHQIDDFKQLYIKHITEIVKESDEEQLQDELNGLQ